MTSSASSANPLTDYLAGRITATQLAVAVAGAYYGETGNGAGDALRPIIEVIERAHPGVVELRASEARPGFDIRLAERPFPKRYEAELRQAVELALQKVPASRGPFPDSDVARKPRWLSRILAAVRKILRG